MKAYQIVAQIKGQSHEVLEVVKTREDAEYAIAHYMLYPIGKEYTYEIVEVGNYGTN